MQAADKPDEEIWDEMVGKLTLEEGCYIVYDVDLPDGAGSRLLFVSWVPDELPRDPKFLLGANREQVKRELEGLDRDLDAKDKDDLAYDKVQNIVRSRY